MYIDKIQLKGRTLDEAILRYKDELERIIKNTDDDPIKVINGQKYVKINGVWSPLSMDEIVVTGRAAVNVRAFVIAPDGIRLHRIPLPKAYQEDSKTYKAGTEVLFVKNAENGKGWAYIKTKDEQFGYIEKTNLFIIRENGNLDKFTKKFHFVEKEAGEYFENIIKENYSDYKYETGDDNRTITQAFRFLNETSGHDHGIYLGKKEKSVLETATDLLRDAHDPWMHDARSLYEEIRLTKHKIVRLPNTSYIKYLQDTGNIDVRPDGVNFIIDGVKTTIKVIETIAGFIAGLVEGFLMAVWEALSGIIDLISQVVTIFKKLITGELLEDLKKLYNTIKELSKKELIDLAKGLMGAAGKAIEKILNDWDNLSTFEKARTLGKIVGAIILEIILVVFTGGTANAAKWAGKLGKAGKGLMKVAKLGDKVKGAGLEKIKEIGDKIKDKVAKDIPDKFKNKRKKNDYENENDPKNIQRQLLLNQARVTAELMDANGSTKDELLAVLNTTAKLYPKLSVKWPTTLKRDNIYSIGMVASAEKSVDGHFSSGDEELKGKLENDLFHGTSKKWANGIRKYGVDLSKTEKYRDFNSAGKGTFYVSDNFRETMSFMRWKKNKVLDQEGLSIKIDFVTFNISSKDLKKLDIKIFENDNDDWVKFVTGARKGTLNHKHDVVIGPKLANPRQMKRYGDGASAIFKDGKYEFQIGITSDKGAEILNKSIKK